VNLQEILADVLDHVRGMWRYRWWAAGISWLIAVCGWLYVYSMPDIYQASTKVFVDTNTLLRPLMEGLTAQQNPLDEVRLVSRAVLTRPNLTQVAHDTDLSLTVESVAEMEALVTRLQNSIVVTGGRDNIFTIDYQDRDREKAVDVVAAVLDTFVENSLGNQGSDSAMTERALASELRSHEERLLRAEADLAQFKRDNLGYMPGETGDYYDQLQAALGAVSQKEQQIRLLEQRREELRRQIEGEEPVFGLMSSFSDVGGGCVQYSQIMQIESQISALRVQYTEKHPRIKALEDMIVGLEEQCDADMASNQLDTSIAAVPQGGQGSQGPQPLEMNPVYQNLRVQLSNADVELVELRSQLDSNRATVARLQRDVDKISEVETQLKQLNRDYGVVQARHQELLRRWEDLQAKNRLDPVTDQVQFRRIEPPFAMADPVGPNRPLLLAGVLVFALGAGGGIAFALNRVNPTFFTRRALTRAAALPVLGAVTMILDPAQLRYRRLEGVLWVATYVGLLVLNAAVVMFANPGSQLFRRLMS
jgi:polysaccharide chain length determinant protein (PEP-CTERM system associated)